MAFHPVPGHALGHVHAAKTFAAMTIAIIGLIIFAYLAALVMAARVARHTGLVLPWLLIILAVGFLIVHQVYGLYLLWGGNGTAPGLWAEVTDTMVAALILGSLIVIAKAFVAARRTERALRESRAQFRALVDHSPAKIHIKDRDGRYLVINRQSERLVRLREEEVIGKTSFDLFPHDMAATFHAHDMAVVRENRPIEREEQFPIDGELRTYLTVKFPIHDTSGKVIAVGSMGTDITERKRVESALRHSEEQFRNLVEGSIQGVMIHRGLRPLFVNRAWVDIFGYGDPAEILAMESVLPLISEAWRARFAQHYNAASSVSARPPEREIAGIRRDGSLVWFEHYARPVVWDGEGAVQSVVVDVTARKQMEEQLRLARDEAELASRAKSEFLANMSHELRTPLNAIIGFSELIRDQRIGPIGNAKYAEYASDIFSAGQHLLEVINDILDLSKIESGTEALNEQEIDVADLLYTSMVMVRQRAQANDITLECDPIGDFPALRADLRKMKQILINLLSNAIKFTPAGGTVRLSAGYGMAEGVRFQVSDTGIGIAAEDIPKALAPFQQVESSLSRSHEGSGLGLPLAKALVEMHGGTLELESEPGRGTTVTVRLPARRLIQPPSRAEQVVAGG
ncbi:MAG: PAS domain S-box protein [Alphaproteobacteria bacterium]|nr:MAG: PAS domain S-box protein [Alphaproteobacteria bacterium]